MLLNSTTVIRIRALSVCASILSLATCLTSPGTAVASDASATSIANESVLQLNREDLPSSAPLLFVGPGIVTSNDTETTVTVLGQTAIIDFTTEFPRGLISPGDYIAVAGHIERDGTVNAASVIRLGGAYSAGNSPVYLHGTVKSLTESGIAHIGNAAIDLAQAYGGSQMSALQPNDVVEVLGFEAPGPHQLPMIFATAAKNHASSGVRGITGSGVRGITGSGVRGVAMSNEE